MKRIELGTKGQDYLIEALRSNYGTSLRSGLSNLNLAKGRIVTWVPDVLQSSDFSLKGLGLAYDDDLWVPFRDKVQGFVEQSPHNLVFTESRPVEADVTTEWLRLAPPGVRRFAVKCSDPQSDRARWEKYAGVLASSSPETIESLIDEAFPFAQLYVFTQVLNEGLAHWLEEREMTELTSHTQALAVDVFDGSGVLLWQRE